VTQTPVRRGIRRLLVGRHTAFHGQIIAIPPQDDSYGALYLVEEVGEDVVKQRRFTKRFIRSSRHDTRRAYFAEETLSEEEAQDQLAHLFIDVWVSRKPE
jgi:hypothetical protein